MNTNIIFVSIAIGLGLILAFSIGLSVGKSSVSLGNTTESFWDAAGGYRVNGTEFVDSSGNISLTGTRTLTVAAESNLDTLVQGGDVTTKNASTSGQDLIVLTAAEVCDSVIIKVSNSGETGGGTVQLPTSTDLIADCLPAIGDFKDVKFWNNSTGTPEIMTFTFGWALASTTLDLQYVGATGTDSAIRIKAGNFSIIRFQNLDGTTTTVDWIPLINK